MPEAWEGEGFLRSPDFGVVGRFEPLTSSRTSHALIEMTPEQFIDK
jgi:hypothetical protein